jgi:WD40 repeat protein
MRDLVHGLGPGGRVLQSVWAESGGLGSLAVFFDNANVGARPDANIPETLKQGLLQTRGGGIVAILATPGYFNSRFCQAELRAAHLLATSSASTERVNLCIVGVCIKEATLRSGLAALNLPGLAAFQYKLVPCLQQDANLLRREIASIILSQGSKLVPGKTKKASLGDMLVETYTYLKSKRLDLELSLRDAFEMTAEQSFTWTELIAKGHSDEVILSKLDECFRKNPVYAHAASCLARLEAFRCKWGPKAWSGDVVDAVSRIMADALVEQQDAVTDTAAVTTSTSHQPAAAIKKRAPPTPSSRGTADIVGVDFLRSRSEELDANAVRDEERLRGLLQQLEDFGRLRRADCFIRWVRTSDFTERCVLRLTVELRNDLQPYQQNDVRDILSCIYEILVDCAPATDKKAADAVILGALYKGACLCLVVEASSAILDALALKLAESGMRLPIGYGEAYITNIHPMGLVKNTSIDFPTSNPEQEKEDTQETEPDVWLLGIRDAHFLVPNNSKAIDCLLTGGVKLKELAIDNGDRLDMWLPQVQFAVGPAITAPDNTDEMDKGKDAIKEWSQDFPGVAKSSSEVYSASISSVAWSPNSQRIASVSLDSTIRLWNASICAPELTLAPCGVSAISWSPGGTCIASGSWDSKVRVWDVATGACGKVLLGHARCVSSISWSPDGERIASGSWDSTVRVWNASTGACGQVLSAHSGCVSSVRWSPYQLRIASGSWDNTVRLWNAATGACEQVLTAHSGCVSSVSWSPDGQRIASGSWDLTVRVWDAATGACETVLAGHTNCVSSATWSPDGQSIASGSWDNTVRVWHAATGACENVLNHSNYVTSVSWSPDGQSIAFGSRDTKVHVCHPPSRSAQYTNTTLRQSRTLNVADETLTSSNCLWTRRVLPNGDEESVGVLEVDDLVTPPNEEWPMSEETYVFISHTGKDNGNELIARTVHFFLKKVVKVKAFLDDGIPTATNTTEVLAAAAYRCTHALVVFSPSYRTSRFCVKELNTFMKRFNQRDGISIIPVLCGVSDLNDYHSDVSNIVWVPCMKTNIVDFLVKTLWPILLKVFGRAALNERALEGRLCDYVEQMRGVTVVPQELESFYARNRGQRHSCWGRIFHTGKRQLDVAKTSV